MPGRIVEDVLDVYIMKNITYPLVDLNFNLLVFILIGSLSNHDDDGNKNSTNLYI